MNPESSDLSIQLLMLAKETDRLRQETADLLQFSRESRKRLREARARFERIALSRDPD
jgi:hypothetical protein